MLGPDALSAENAEDTLANLDRMSAMPPKPSPQSATNYQKEYSSYDSDLSSLGKIMDDTRRMQHRPSSAYQSVQEAAKGVLFDLSDLSGGASHPTPAALLPEPKYSIEESTERGSALPKLVIAVQLPMINSASEAIVDVNGQLLKILVPGKCILNLTLPSLVEEGSIKAKWNRSRKDLMISLIKIH